MPDTNGHGIEADTAELDRIPTTPAPFPFPLNPPASGLYEWRFQLLRHGVASIPASESAGAELEDEPANASEEDMALDEALATPRWRWPWWWLREELRLDVDGRYPQMTVSGANIVSSGSRVEWIAGLKPVARSVWTGSIWYKHGATSSFPYTQVRVTAYRSWVASHRSVRVTFSGPGVPSRTRTYRFKSPYFHPVNFEYDRTQDAHPVTAIDTCAHPNRPATLPCERLSLDTIYRRAGFEVTRSASGLVPLSGSGANGTWSDNEMHDAMQMYWSRFANVSQWAMWVFFARLHDRGNSLGGIMFDDIGPNHRQGTAIFTDAFISNPPPGDPAPAAWVERMRLWTAAHEMGHAFNLAHSWQKQHPPSWGTPWIPLANEPEARSFMNYPYSVTGGQTAFFSDFEYRFSDPELLFMRHAPSSFVRMGDADWFDDHGFEEALLAPDASLRLEVRANRERAEFEFLEPVILELKLMNVGTGSRAIDVRALESRGVTVIVKREGTAARQWSPYGHYLSDGATRLLASGDAMYAPLPVFAGTNGWDLSIPGDYRIQVAIELGDTNVVSEPLAIRVQRPASWEEENFAQDMFSEDVGRCLAFGGSRLLRRANDTLEEAYQRFSQRRVAIHAAYALANPESQEYKRLSIDAKAPTMLAAIDGGGSIEREDANLDRLAGWLKFLDEQPQEVAETMGHIRYREGFELIADRLHEAGEPRQAVEQIEQVGETLDERGVLSEVVREVRDHAAALGSAVPA